MPYKHNELGMTLVTGVKQMFFEGHGDTYDGYEISVNDGVNRIRFGIGGEAQCCEIYGIEQLPAIDMVGKKIVNVSLVDCDDDHDEIGHQRRTRACVENCIALKLNFDDHMATTLHAYNTNGYYPHTVYIEYMDGTHVTHNI